MSAQFVKNFIKNLYNTDLVLLGAVDLVEEGDATIYSINRIDELYLNDGSTVKLDQIVKYLGEITSDYEFIVRAAKRFNYEFFLSIAL